jgi:hypothetical protein
VKAALCGMLASCDENGAHRSEAKLHRHTGTFPWNLSDFSPTHLLQVVTASQQA